MTVDQRVIQNPVDAQSGQGIYKTDPGGLHTPQHPQQYLGGSEEEIGEADDLHIFCAFRNDMGLVGQDPQGRRRKEKDERKHDCRQSQCHTQGHLGGFFDTIDVFLAPEPGGKYNGAVTGAADEHLE